MQSMVVEAPRDSRTSSMGTLGQVLDALNMF